MATFGWVVLIVFAILGISLLTLFATPYIGSEIALLVYEIKKIIADKKIDLDEKSKWRKEFNKTLRDKKHELNDKKLKLKVQKVDRKIASCEKKIKPIINPINANQQITEEVKESFTQSEINIQEENEIIIEEKIEETTENSVE